MGTQHDKGRLVAGPMSAQMGMTVRDIPIDTDRFGTFTGERPRTLAPIQAAAAKARAALEATSARLALGSEGSFGPDPLLPWIAVNTEHLVLVDRALEIEVTERVSEPHPVYAVAAVTPATPLDDILTRARFPEHRLIVRPSGRTVTDDDVTIIKGVGTLADLITAIARACDESPEGQAVVENDLRAHCSPSRQRVIERAADRLATRLRHLCPECAAPGWGVIRRVTGLPCAACGSANTSTVRADVLGCVRCEATLEVAVPAAAADPAQCALCNP